MEKLLRVIIKKVGEEPYVDTIENTLEAKQKIVGGYIEVVDYKDALIICNEEGKIMNLDPNVAFDYDYIAGDFLIVGDDWENADFKSLTEEQIKEFIQDINVRSFKHGKKEV